MDELNAVHHELTLEVQALAEQTAPDVASKPVHNSTSNSGNEGTGGTVSSG